MRRKDYSIPDCPKIGKYDGLGMAAVPLAIADKERELGLCSDSNIEHYDESSCKKDLDDMYELGKKEGYKKGFIDGKVEIYKKFMKASKDTWLSGKLGDFEIEADTFLLCHWPEYK